MTNTHHRPDSLLHLHAVFDEVQQTRPETRLVVNQMVEVEMREHAGETVQQGCGGEPGVFAVFSYY
jgi:hypothetical protein